MKKATYSFACEKSCRSLSDRNGRQLWTLTLAIDELPTELKLGPNARHATPSKPLVKRMLKTLETEPENFVFYNGGIMVVAESINVTREKVSLVCQEPDEDEDFPGHGVLNGGHTYLALKQALESSGSKYEAAREFASVIVTVGINVDDEEISDISRARNTSEKVPEYALRELKGEWKLLKQNIPAETRPLVAVKPGDPDAPDAKFNTTDLVKRLALVNAELFPAADDSHPIQAYTSIGSLVKGFSVDKFEKYAHLLSDVLWLEGKIHEEHVLQNGKQLNGKSRKLGKVNGCSSKETTLLCGRESPLTIAAPFVFPIIAAFRVFLTADGTWSKPVAQLWDEWGSLLVDRVWDLYAEHGRSSSASFGRSKATWSQVCQRPLLAAVRDGLL